MTKSILLLLMLFLIPLFLISCENQKEQPASLIYCQSDNDCVEGPKEGRCSCINKDDFKGISCSLIDKECYCNEKLQCGERPSSEKAVECATNEDCITGGCSGTICQSKNREPIFTTCEYLPEYECYKTINCGCVNGKCQWEKTMDFEKCLQENR